MAHRRRALIAAGTLALLAAGHTALWFWGAAVLEQQVEANLAHGLAPGWRATHGPLTRTGWPLAATVRAPGTVFRQDPAGFAWSAGTLSATVSLLRPQTLVLTAEGPQSVQLAPAAPVPVTVETMRAEVPLTPGVPARAVTVEVAGLAATPPQGLVTLARLDLRAESRPAAQQGEPALSVDLTLARLGLPPGTWPLGPTVDRIALDAVVTGPAPRTPDPQERAELWRDGGGAMELRKLDIAWGDVRLTGSATLALDDALQPMGAATARIAGFNAALDALVASGVLAPRAAVAARAVLALMARPAESGPPVVEVPFSLQNRTLSLGRIPLVRFPELAWRPPF